MTWIKTSDDYWRRPVTLRLLDDGARGIEAIALDRLVESWVGEQLTDGHVPQGQPARMFAPRDPTAAIAALIDVGLWAPEPGGWRLTTWFEPYGTKRKPRNPSKADVLLDRQRRHDLGVRGGTANAEKVVEEGRRDPDDGTFTNRTVGEADGATVGPAPTVRLDPPPTVAPSPYPVSRIPVTPSPEDTSPPPPSPTAEKGRRKNGTSPRNEARNPRVNGQSPRGQGRNPRKVQADEKRNTPTLAGAVLAEMAKGLGGGS